MSVVTVCKNIIMSSNKKGWTNPEPAIRVASSKSGKVTGRGHFIGIKDSLGNIVAKIETTQDGRPIVKCGAKVAIFTDYPVEVLN